MTQERWTAVDQYFSDLLAPADAALESTLQSSAAAGLPPINVSPNQGKFLHLLARSMNARRILEIGTLGGYSTIWLARALPADGRLITLEADPKHAEVARANIARAGLSDRVELRLGRALETLPTIAQEVLASSTTKPRGDRFDLTFIDADKPSTPEYFQWAMRLSHPGSLIIVDNVVRNGAIIDAQSDDASVQGVQRLTQMMAAEPRVTATTIQTVGGKGYDGFAIALVTAET